MRFEKKINLHFRIPYTVQSFNAVCNNSFYTYIDCSLLLFFFQMRKHSFYQFLDNLFEVFDSLHNMFLARLFFVGKCMLNNIEFFCFILDISLKKISTIYIFFQLNIFNIRLFSYKKTVSIRIKSISTNF